MFTYITNLFTRFPKTGSVVLFWIKGVAVSVPASAAWFMRRKYLGKNGNPNSALINLLKGLGYTIIGAATLNGYTVLDIAQNTANKETIAQTVSDAFDAKHDAVRRELERALGTFNERTAHLEDLVSRVEESAKRIEESVVAEGELHVSKVTA